MDRFPLQPFIGLNWPEQRLAYFSLLETFVFDFLSTLFGFSRQHIVWRHLNINMRKLLTRQKDLKGGKRSAHAASLLKARGI